MTDVRCWNCDKKLGQRAPDARGVVIVCTRCGVKNVIGATPPLDKTLVKA